MVILKFEDNRRLSRHEAKQAIRLCVERSAFHVTKHAMERMKERDITMLDIINCLIKGEVVEDLTISEKRNGWNTVVEKITSGRRLCLPVCLTWQQDVLVITTIIKR